MVRHSYASPILMFIPLVTSRAPLRLKAVAFQSRYDLPGS